MNNIMFRSACCAAACLVSTFALAADIKVGINIPQTGVVAVYGQPMMKSVPLLAKEIAGHTVTYSVLDSNSDATRSAANTRKLVTEDKVDVLFGEGSVTGTVAMIDIAAEGKTPLIAMTTPLVVVTPLDEKKRWVFKILPNDDLGGEIISKYMAAQGIKTVGFIGQADAYGQGWLEVLKERFSKIGISVVAAEFFNRTDTSATAQALKLVAAKPDAVFIAVGGTPAIVPAHDVRQRGFTGPIYQTHGISSREVIERGGKDMDGAIFAGEPFTIHKDLPADSPFRKLGETYATKYKELNGADASLFGAHMFDCMQLFSAAVPEALKRGQPGTVEFREAIRDELEKVNKVYLNNGLLSNSPTNHAGYDPSGAFIIKVENGNFHLIK
jgi:branched-chain amino acid transport system substrate-binding protein